MLQAYTYEREYKVPGDDPGPFLWRSAMMGAWQIDPTDTRRWTDEERESARRAAGTYKEWIRPLLRDVKVHHILPRPDGVHWGSLFFWTRGENLPPSPKRDRQLRDHRQEVSGGSNSHYGPVNPRRVRAPGLHRRKTALL